MNDFQSSLTTWVCPHCEASSLVYKLDEHIRDHNASCKKYKKFKNQPK